MTIFIKTRLTALCIAAAVVMAACAPRAEAEIIKGPYLQTPAKTAMTIMWESDKGGKAVVRYGEAGLTKTFTMKEGRAVNHRKSPKDWHKVDTYWYEARLKNLKPGATYRYRVEVGDAKSKESTFKTVPQRCEKFTFIVYGDTRIRSMEWKLRKTKSDEERIAYQRKQAAPQHKIAALFDKYKPAFIIHTGDAVDSGKRYHQWKYQFFEPLENVINHIPIWISRGNHDGSGDNFTPYFSLPGNELYYSFDYGGAHFVCLDMEDRKGENKEHLAAMLAWCKKNLAKTSAQWRFAFFHYPIYNIGSHGSATKRADFLPLFKRHRLDVAFASHSHLYERFFPVNFVKDKNFKPITHVVTGGGGAPLSFIDSSPYLASHRLVHHFLVVDIDGPKFTMRAIDINGKEFDSVTIVQEGRAYNAEYMKLVKPELPLVFLTFIKKAGFAIKKKRDAGPPAKGKPMKMELEFAFPGMKGDVEIEMKLTAETAKSWKLEPARTGITVKKGGTVPVAMTATPLVEVRQNKEEKDFIDPALKIEVKYKYGKLSGARVMNVYYGRWPRPESL